MLTEFATLATLLWGTLALRPYVVAFLVVFMIAASRDLGPMRAQLVAGDFFDPYGEDYRSERTLRDLVEWGVTAMNVKLTDQYVFDGMNSTLAP